MSSREEAAPACVSVSRPLERRMEERAAVYMFRVKTDEGAQRRSANGEIDV